MVSATLPVNAVLTATSQSVPAGAVFDPEIGKD
jgi:hypothetical protein